MLRRGLLNLLCKGAYLSHCQHSSASCLSQHAPVAAAAAVFQQVTHDQAWPISALSWNLQKQQQLHTSICSSAPAAQHHVQLDALRPAPGSSQLRKRWGRGDGGDRGTYCGRGIKGQKARKGGKPHLLFDGGQKQMKKFPKVWLKPSSLVLFKEVSLSRVLRWVQLGLLDPTEVITMKDLRDSGCVSKAIRWGIELVAHGTEVVRTPLHFQVSSVSPEAFKVVEAAGGSVTRVYYTPLGLRALLKPENFEKKCRALPRPVRAWPPKEEGKYDVIGQLPPLKQLPVAAQSLAAAH